MARSARSLVAPLALWAACGPVLAQLESEVFTNSASGAVVTDAVTGPGAAQVQRSVSDSFGGSRTSTLEGVAAADQQTLKSRASLSISSTIAGNYATAKSESSFGKIVTVGAGTSGLAQGTQLMLNVPIRFDGAAVAGSSTFGGGSFSYTSADISLRYRIVDLDQLVSSGEGGPRPRELMSFSYGARLIYDSRFDATARAGWRGRSTNTAAITGGDADVYLGSVGGGGSIDLPVDSGPLNFVIESAVGNRLSITASLDVFVQVDASFGTGYASGNYENTFDAGVASDINGLQLAGETPGVYAASAVPEPGGLLLSLCGLAALGGWLRVRRASA